MIYTVTFNPAIDYVMQTKNLKTGITNRSLKEEYFYGGKGINVSTILHRLGVETTALGFISGFTGDALAAGLKEEGLTTDFIKLAEGFTRINVKIKDETIKDKEETEINGQGPTITADAVEALFRKLDILTGEDMLVISGSVPSSMPTDTYQQILRVLAKKNLPVVVDATGQLLLQVLQYHPFLIKPNNDELADMLGKPMDTTEQIIAGAKTLRKKGSQNVLVSRGAKGALLVTEDDEIILQDAIKGNAINTVGAGDSMIAGFLSGYIKTKDYHYALHLGTAAGSATACSPGLANAKEIERRMSL